MYPEITPGVSSYGIFLWLAVAAGSVLTFLAARREKVIGWRLALFQLLLALSAVAGAKLWSWLERGTLGPIGFEILHGYRYPGGVAAAAALLLAARSLLRSSLSLAALSDLVAPSIALSMAVVRIGCFLAGCCFGVPSTVPWAISFPKYSPAWGAHLTGGFISESAPASLRVHPLELYFGLWSLAVALFLLRRRASKRYDGEIALLFLLLHEGGKAVLELLRAEPRPWVQLASLLPAVLAVVLWGRWRGRRGVGSAIDAEDLARKAHPLDAGHPGGEAERAWPG